MVDSIGCGGSGSGFSADQQSSVKKPFFSGSGFSTDQQSSAKKPFVRRG